MNYEGFISYNKHYQIRTNNKVININGKENHKIDSFKAKRNHLVSIFSHILLMIKLNNHNAMQYC